MSRYLIIIEDTATGFSAYSPDLPGCVATGATRDEVEREMHEAHKMARSVQRGRLVGFLAGVALRALSVGEMEDRVRALEQRIADLTRPRAA